MRHKYTQRVEAALGIFAILSLLLLAFSGNLGELVENRTAIVEFIESAGVWAPLLFVLIQVLQVLFPIVSSYITIALAGALFGFVWGMIYSIAGLMIGVWICFKLARKIGRPIEHKLLSKKHIDDFDQLFKKYGAYVVFVGRIAPLVPNNALSFGAGLTKMPHWKFTVASFLGTVPSVILLSLFGEKLFEGSFGTGWIIFIVAVILVLSIGYKFRHELHHGMHRFIIKVEKFLEIRKR